MSFVVIDTETSGLPTSFCSAANNLSCWDSCRLIQLAWMIYSDDNQLISKDCKIVKPSGFTIPDSATAIHKISTEMALECGEPIADVLSSFLESIKDVNLVVAHNIKFDFNVILSEMIRLGLDTDVWTDIERHCTMLINTKPYQRWPKLNVLYKKLIGPIDESINLHSADGDCLLCAEIYIHTKNN